MQSFGRPIGAGARERAPAGLELATADGKSVRIWDTDGTPRATLTGHKRGVGRFAVICDPQGAALAVLKPDPDMH